jgi:hypothetical protein
MANFKQACAWMEEGKKVRQKSWENKKYYWFVDDRFSFDNLWCIKDSSGTDACMIRSFVEADDWEIFKNIKPTFLESIQENINVIRRTGDNPALIIFNEDDWNDIEGEFKINKLEYSPEFIFGVKVLQIPNHLRDNTFLNDGQAMVIPERRLKQLKEVFLHEYNKS